MGQSYLIANLDKREYIYPHAFGDGYKLLEFGHGGLTMTALAVLLADGNGHGSGDLVAKTPGGEMHAPAIIGHWKGDRIVVAGDCADTPGNNGLVSGGESNVYTEANRDGSAWADISLDVIEALAADTYLRRQIVEGLSGECSSTRAYFKKLAGASTRLDKIVADYARAGLRKTG